MAVKWQSFFSYLRWVKLCIIHSLFSRSFPATFTHGGLLETSFNRVQSDFSPPLPQDIVQFSFVAGLFLLTGFAKSVTHIFYGIHVRWLGWPWQNLDEMLAVWQGALSLAHSHCADETFLYVMLFVCFSHNFRMPTPEADNALPTIMGPPPWFIEGTKHSGL